MASETLGFKKHIKSYDRNQYTTMARFDRIEVDCLDLFLIYTYINYIEWLVYTYHVTSQERLHSAPVEMVCKM